jgi:hypothetical protein
VLATAAQIAQVEERMGRDAFDHVTSSSSSSATAEAICYSFQQASFYSGEIKTLVAQQRLLLEKLTQHRTDKHALEGHVFKLKCLPDALTRLGRQYQHNAKGLQESRQVMSEQVVLAQPCASPFHHSLEYNALPEAFALYYGPDSLYFGENLSPHFSEKLHELVRNRLKLYAVRYELTKRLRMYARDPVY